MLDDENGNPWKVVGNPSGADDGSMEQMLKRLLTDQAATLQRKFQNQIHEQSEVSRKQFEELEGRPSQSEKPANTPLSPKRNPPPTGDKTAVPVVLQTLPQSSLETPKFRDSSNMRDALDEIRMWHSFVNKSKYSNSMSTYEAIRMLNTETSASRLSNMQTLSHHVREQILKMHDDSNVHDPALFNILKSCWETFAIPHEIHSIEYFRMLAAGLVSVTHNDMTGTGIRDLIPVPIYNLALLCYLNVGTPDQAELKRRLWHHLQDMQGQSALIHFIISEIFVDDIVVSGHPRVVQFFLQTILLRSRQFLLAILMSLVPLAPRTPARLITPQ